MTAADPSVLVDMRKYDGSLNKQWTAARLGEDEHGVWLGTEAGTFVDTPKGGYTCPQAFVMVVPRGEWWTACFNAGQGSEVYCDVCTVPEWSADGSVVRTVDLDLDVARLRNGDVLTLDEEEFAAHRARYGYPASVVDQARQTCAWLAEAGRRGGVEPFVSTYRAWLSGFGEAPC